MGENIGTRDEYARNHPGFATDRVNVSCQKHTDDPWGDSIPLDPNIITYVSRGASIKTAASLAIRIGRLPRVRGSAGAVTVNQQPS